VYVDEPDLGRVRKGIPVTITWDALPNRTWTGTVDRTPTQIVALGSRQVGEVLCVIENPGHQLLPGTNVNVEIRAAERAAVLTIPKEALRRENGQTGVFTLNGNALEWKRVEVGISATTRAEVTGIEEGAPVALSSEKPLKSGMQVTPVFP
jgi:HlyD family secretion protein